MLQNKRYIIAPILCMLFIFALSSVPMEEGRLAGWISLPPFVGNALHIPLFGVLAFLWMRAFDKNSFPLKKAVVYTVIIVLTYAVFDEFHQSFVPGRFASLGDILSDAIGCLAALIIYMKVVLKKNE